MAKNNQSAKHPYDGEELWKKWFNPSTLHESPSSGTGVYLPWLEHALRTMPAKLDDKKTREKLEEIVKDLSTFTRESTSAP
ncbi:Hypothetical protein NTJ_03649 [Nesidiocoris tenuis]|uniref:Uncharacterized protein n=1 Tax=Nesidiocoris tenuis TaxID=355587 RepID=A0ABN7AIY5_9HEMI|nr:Hypothetical protein NTJ_03649 [Nesidiocoris tenuis]